jgi:ABC-2 type transport system permease protein
MMTQFGALVRKDLRLFIADPRAVIMSVVAPIVIGSFFGYVLGGQSGKSATSRIPVAVIDSDQSNISREIVARLAKHKTLEVKLAEPEAARDSVRKGKTTVTVLIPKNFGADAGRAFFSSARKPTLGVLYDPSHSIELSMVQGILTGEVMQVVSKEMFAGESGQQVIRESLPQIEKTPFLTSQQKVTLRDLLRNVQDWNKQAVGGRGILAEGLSIPYQVNEEAVTSGTGVRYNSYAHSFAGMGVQFILFVGVEVGIGMLLTRQRGIWKRLRAAPLSKAMLLGSRSASSTITSMGVLTILFTFARVVFKVQIAGSLAGFLGVCAAFSMMTASFGLLIAAVGKTPDATRGLSILVTLLMVMLGGAWIPTFIFPQWLQTLTLAVPTRWAVDGLDAMTWRGLSFAAAMGPIAMLLLYTGIFATLAIVRFRWEAD